MSPIDLQFARLAVLTKIDREKWERIIAAPVDIQTLELQNYADQDWTDPSSPLSARRSSRSFRSSARSEGTWQGLRERQRR